jgi:hypothetical protein
MSNSLTLSGDSVTSIAVDSARQIAGSLEGLSQVTYGGTLLVRDLAATGGFAAGQFFHLFSALRATGQFSAIVPAPGPGLTWQFSPDSGSLYIVTQPSIRTSRADARNLLIAWSGPGFRLQVQTNSLSDQATNWFDYPGAPTSPVILPIDPTHQALFLRLVGK